jgi:hypothetical protein
MSFKYFTLFLFMCTLKFQLLELTQSQIWIWKQLRKNGSLPSRENWKERSPRWSPPPVLESEIIPFIFF